MKYISTLKDCFNVDTSHYIEGLLKAKKIAKEEALGERMVAMAKKNGKTGFSLGIMLKASGCPDHVCVAASKWARGELDE